MVYPPIATESTSRSSLEQSTQSPLCQSQSPVPSLLLSHHHHHHHHHHHQQHQQHQQQQQQQQQLHHRQSQQQQQILYTPYNTIPNCIPPSNQPQCIYPNTRRNPSNTVTLRSQDSFRGVKNTKWKSRPLRIKEHQTNPNLQHSLSYPQPPPPQPPPPPPPPSFVLFDQIQNHISAAPAAPIAPIYRNQSSTLFNLGGIYSNENYTNFNPNVITQPYYKPPEVQTYCLIDRPSSQTTFAHQQIIPPVTTYYNATSNTNLNHQNIKSFVASSVSAAPSSSSSSNVYSTGGGDDNRIIATAVGPTQIFSNSLTNHGLNLSIYSNDKLMANSSTAITNELSVIKCPEKILIDRDDRIISDTDQLFTSHIHIDNDKLSGIINDNIIKNHCDERFSDESSNFDFTIEAEKMVSALCNTTSCELDKDVDECGEMKKNTEKKLLSRNKDNENDNNDENEINTDRCHDNIDKYKPWYYNDFSSKIKLSGESIGTQTTDVYIDKSQYPELIRKTIYWGCNEVDKIIKNSTIISPKQNWLQNLSSATKIALTKSSTCFPIFSGDKIFSQDLINALLRVGNGWLILDHYLNKHHNPKLNDKYDNELNESFKKWEVLTNNLLKNVIKTFIQLENRNFTDAQNNFENSTLINSSFPGDISLYINYGIFGNPSAVAISSALTPQSIDESKSTTTFTRKCPYTNNENRELKNHWSTTKESKLRTKWTISEHTRRSNDIFKKNHDIKSNWNLFPKYFTINQLPQLINTIEPQQKLHCNFFSSQNDMNINNSNQLMNINSSLNTEAIPVHDNRRFWISNNPPNSLYNFTSTDTSRNNLSRKMTLLSQIETKKSDSIDGNTINLSAWFASMRNKRLSNIENTSSSSSSTWLAPTSSTVPLKFRESRNTGASSRMDTSRQLRTLKNMRTIQCAPWTANHLIDEHKNTTKSGHDEYDSSEDVRVYMKPGSYNVPKKKYQSRRSQKRESFTAQRNNRQNSQNSLNNDETLCSSNSLIISRSNASSSSSSTSSQDIQNKDATWKAACASAGLLLNALKARENISNIDDDKIVNSTPKNSEDSLRHWDNLIIDEDKKQKINFNLTENDSESLKLSSLNENIFSRDDHQKNNIKTDSWLIRTLNNVTNDTNLDGVQTKDKNNDDINISPWKKLSDDNKKTEEHSFSLETSHTIAVMTLVDVVGKATYSETVRRFSSTTKPTSCSTIKLIHQKNSDHGKIENNSLCTIDESKSEEQEELMKNENVKIKSDKMIKLKKNKNSNDDRDWSIWYSSKKKQHNNFLGQVILGKLANIHRTLWRMDVTRVLKYPTTNLKVTSTDNNISSSTTVESVNMENYRKIIKNPMFLETIGYKLKNHEYRKVEHVIRDFKRIINNSKLYYKNEKNCIEKIENLSKKLEELVQLNFPDELSLHGRNSSPLHNRKSPNRFITNSNNPIVDNNQSTATTVTYNGEKDIEIAYRKSTRAS